MTDIKTKELDNLDVKTNDEIKNDLVQSDYYQLDQSKVKDISHELNIEDRRKLYQFGSNLQNQVSDIANQILDESREYDISKMQKKLDELLEKFDEADPDELLPEEKNKFSQWLGKITNSFQKQLGLLETTSVKIDSIAESLKGNQQDLLLDADRLQQMNDLQKQLDEDVEYYIAATDYKLNELKTEKLPQLKENAQQDDPRAAQDIQDVNEFIEAIEQRKYDLQLTQSMNLQSRVQLRVIAGINQSLAEKINSMIVTSIPAWRVNFATALNIVKQRSAASTIEKVKKGTDVMLQKNAENVSKSIEYSAKQMNEPDIDIKTLREGRDKIMKSIERYQAITEEGKQRKEKDREEFRRFKEETEQMLGNTEKHLIESGE